MADASQRLTVRLTQAQRKVIAEIAPELAARLKLDDKSQRTVPFTLAELRALKEKAGRAIRQASTGVVRNSLRHVTELEANAMIRTMRPLPFVCLLLTSLPTPIQADGMRNCLAPAKGK